MQVYLARQPILDRDQNIYGYEIFYRSGYTNHYTGTNEDEASSKVILDVFQNLGVKALTTGKPAFINFSSRLIKEEVATLFSREHLVIEVLESVTGDLEIMERFRTLKAQGYTIALDDFVVTKEREPLLELADIVKIDFQSYTHESLELLVPKLRRGGLTLLAEKVESRDDFRRAVGLGFSLFQGYFFSRPELVTAKRLNPLHLTCLELIMKINELELDYGELAAIISKDVSLTYSLIKLVNSAAFARRETTQSVKQALVILGEKEIKKWIVLMALQRMSVTKPDAPIITSLLRGRFTELLAERTQWRNEKELLYLGGLFSMLDVLLQRPLGPILDDVQAPKDIGELLLHGTGKYSQLWGLVMAYERANWALVEELAAGLDLSPSSVSEAYRSALAWCSFYSDLN